MLEKTLHLIRGGFTDRVPACPIVGWYYENEQDFARNCTAAVEEGFCAVKLKVGIGSLPDDIQQLKIARKAVGDGIDLMADANQAANAPRIPDWGLESPFSQALKVF